MKPQNFKQLALLVIMALTAIIMGLVCIYIEKDEQRHQESLKTIILIQDTVKVNKSGEAVK